jgi:hypothetical protein
MVQHQAGLMLSPVGLINGRHEPPSFNEWSGHSWKR